MSNEDRENCPTMFVRYQLSIAHYQLVGVQ